MVQRVVGDRRPSTISDRPCSPCLIRASRAGFVVAVRSPRVSHNHRGLLSKPTDGGRQLEVGRRAGASDDRRCSMLDQGCSYRSVSTESTNNSALNEALSSCIRSERQAASGIEDRGGRLIPHRMSVLATPRRVVGCCDSRLSSLLLAPRRRSKKNDGFSPDRYYVQHQFSTACACCLHRQATGSVDLLARSMTLLRGVKQLPRAGPPCLSIHDASRVTKHDQEAKKATLASDNDQTSRAFYDPRSSILDQSI